MGDREEAVLETKLDILIIDFQRFREEQSKHNIARSKHAASEDKVQASILTTQKWHTVIGSSMVLVLAYLVTQHIGG